MFQLQFATEDQSKKAHKNILYHTRLEGKNLLVGADYCPIATALFARARKLQYSVSRVA